MNYLVGQVMKKLKSDGKLADPILIRKVLDQILEEELKKRKIT